MFSKLVIFLISLILITFLFLGCTEFNNEIECNISESDYELLLDETNNLQTNCAIAFEAGVKRDNLCVESLNILLKENNKELINLTSLEYPKIIFKNELESNDDCVTITKKYKTLFTNQQIVVNGCQSALLSINNNYNACVTSLNFLLNEKGIESTLTIIEYDEDGLIK